MDMAGRLDREGELFCCEICRIFGRTPALPFGDGETRLWGLGSGKRQKVLRIVRRRARFCHAFTIFGTVFSLSGKVLADSCRSPVSLGDCGFETSTAHRAENLRSYKGASRVAAFL